jgi:cytochrome c-type biogenesis protein CcmH
MPPTESIAWTAPVAVLAVGLVLGLVFVWRQLRAPRGAREAHALGTPALPLEWRDLEGRREALLTQLRELADSARKRTPEQLARERYALELAAARTLQALDRHPAARAQPTPTASVPVARRGGAEGFLWGVVTAWALASLFFYVGHAAQPREAGGAVTGNTPMDGRAAPTGAGSTPAADPQEQAARAALAQNPDNFDARLALAQALLGRQDMMGVWNETQYVLQREPGHPRALAYQALVRLAMGQADKAVDMLQAALKTDPGLVEGYVHLALVFRRLGRDAEAEQVMTNALQRFPDQRTVLTQLFTELRARVQARDADAGSAPAHPPVDGTGTALPPAHPPVGEATASMPADHPAVAAGASTSAPTTNTPGRSVRGTIDLDPALRAQVPAGSVVFVVVRAAGVAAGPPAVAKRLDLGSFPMSFEIGDADSMSGETLPDPLRLDARLDADGNAMTRDPGDPHAVLDGVRAGAGGLRLVLRR